MPIIDASHPSVTWMGRYCVESSGCVRTGWPCVQGSLHFSVNPGCNSQLCISMEGPGNSIHLWLNESAFFLPPLPSGVVKWHSPFLPPGKYCVRWSTQTPTPQTMRWISLELENALVLPPPDLIPPILFLGDSWSVGFGNICPGHCTHSPQEILKHSDSWQAFPALLAKQMQKPFEVFAISGHGVVKNYGDEVPSLHPLHHYWPHSFPSLQSPPWNKTMSLPSAIIIVLGENDFSTLPIPSLEQFCNNGKELLRPFAKLAHQVPILWGVPSDRPQLQHAVKNLQNSLPWFCLVNLPPMPASAAKGCHMHPHLEHHQIIARDFAKELRKF